MPSVPSDHGAPGVPEDAIRVLITGFGPFSRFEVNPSWLAVKPLHNIVLEVDPAPVQVHGQDVLAAHPGRKRNIHITTMKVPVTYADVLSIVPKLHARPPVLPESDEVPSITPPSRGYDLVFHVGVAGRGPMRLETMGDKYGYRFPDVDGKYAPVVTGRRTSGAAGDMSEAMKREAARLDTQSNGPEANVVRGFGQGYGPFSDPLYTPLDTKKIVASLQSLGVKEIVPSYDAGRYLCDFIYYCSLAESQRTAASLPADGKASKVIFLHCPPVDEPLSTEEVSDAIKKIVSLICAP